MTAAAEVDFEDSFMVPAKEFYQAVTVLGEEDLKLKVVENKIVISKSRRRVTIETLNPEDFIYSMPAGDPLQVPRGFVPALKNVCKFMSEDRTKAWANAVRIKNGNVYATNNISVVCAACGSWAKDVDITLPSWVVEYIVARNVELQYMSFVDNSVSFNWADNSWVRSTRLATEMPDMVINLTAQIVDVDFEITAEWREAFEMVVLLSEDMMHICPDKITAGKGHAKIEAEIKSPVEEITMWHPKYLSLVLQQATHFDPSNWPKACSWKGANCKGLVIGRKV
jgi:DNA polymerase III sliding clamp (beta) subunit (PCNA family)